MNPKNEPKLKAPKPKKPPTKKAAALCPDELKGHHQRDESNENICWAFNLTNGCKTKGARCPKGVHKCAKCLRTNHGLATCRVEDCMKGVRGQLKDIEHRCWGARPEFKRGVSPRGYKQG